MSYRPNPRTRRVAVTLAGSAAFVALGAALVWWNQPHIDPYRPGEKIEGITDALGREIPADHPRVQFADVTAAAGIDFRHFHGTRSTQLPEDMGSGAAWGDYDGDGWADLYVVNFAGPLTDPPGTVARSPASNRLYHNQGDGRFADVTAAAGVGSRGHGMGAAWGDADGDGDLDLAATSYGRVQLYRNDGDGRFTDVSAAAGVADPEGFWTGVAWADYDADGDMDFYVCGYVRYQFDPADRTRLEQQYGSETPYSLNPSSYPPERNLLFRNNGDGSFADVAAAAGVDNPHGRSLSATWGDFNADGWPDIYVANDVSDNVMFVNRGDGSFADVSHAAAVADYRGAMGLATGDWDNDGDLDIFITHWIAQENALYVNLLAESAASLPAESAAIPAAPGATAGTLPPAAPASPPTPGGTADAAAGAADAAAGAPDLRFSDMADRYGVGAIALDFVGWGTAFFDYDNDGRLDLLVANGSTFQDPDHPEALVPMRQQLFWNRDDEDGFFEVSSVSGDVYQAQSVGRGAAVADYDNDGDVDAFIVNHGAAPILLRNDGGNARHWLKVRLRGARNRFGIGARLALTADGARQIREVGSGSSYLSQNDVEAAFGLGDAVSVTTLQVRWPGGAVEELAVIPADQTIEVTEGHGWRTIALAGGAAAGGAAAQPAGGGAPIPPASAAAGADPIGSPAPLSRAEQLRFWELQREAMQLMKTESDWRAAADRFREALALNPDHEDALYYLGSCLVEIEDYGAALAQYEHLVAVNPQSLRGFLQIGALHALPEAGELYDLAAAEQAFRAALAINPEESGSLLQLGATALARGDLDGASDDLRNARRLNPKAAEAFYLDGYIHWIRGDREGATTLLAQAIEIAQAQHPTAPAPSEGDTRRAGQQAMMLANAQSRRLFGAPVAALAQHPPGEAVTAATAAAAYQQIEAYLAGLPKRQ